MLAVTASRATCYGLRRATCYGLRRATCYGQPGRPTGMGWWLSFAGHDGGGGAGVGEPAEQVGVSAVCDPGIDVASATNGPAAAQWSQLDICDPCRNLNTKDLNVPRQQSQQRVSADSVASHAIPAISIPNEVRPSVFSWSLAAATVAFLMTRRATARATIAFRLARYDSTANCSTSAMEQVGPMEELPTATETESTSVAGTAMSGILMER